MTKLDFANLEALPADTGHFQSQGEVHADLGQSEEVDFLRSRMVDYESLCRKVNFQHYPQRDCGSDAIFVSQEEVVQFK